MLGKEQVKYGASTSLTRSYSYYEDCGAGSVVWNLRTKNGDYVLFEDGTDLVEASDKY